jgi:hypothetical protein
VTMASLFGKKGQANKAQSQRPNQKKRRSRTQVGFGQAGLTSDLPTSDLCSPSFLTEARQRQAQLFSSSRFQLPLAVAFGRSFTRRRLRKWRR